MIVLMAVLAVPGLLAAGLLVARGRRAVGFSGLAVGVLVTVSGPALESERLALSLASAVSLALVLIAMVLRTRRPMGRRAATAAGVLAGALVGVMPGALLVMVPVVLSEYGLVSSDASQLGFLGLPLAMLGLLVGAGLGAWRSAMGR